MVLALSSNILHKMILTEQEAFWEVLYLSGGSYLNAPRVWNPVVFNGTTKIPLYVASRMLRGEHYPLKCTTEYVSTGTKTTTTK